MDKSFSLARPTAPKKTKSPKQKKKELRAKKSAQHLDIPKIVETWTPVYIEKEQYSDCDGGGYDYDEMTKPCGKCHACTKTLQDIIEVGRLLEFVLVY